MDFTAKSHSRNAFKEQTDGMGDCGRGGNVHFATWIAKSSELLHVLRILELYTEIF